MNVHLLGKLILISPYLQESQLVHSTGFYVLAGWEAGRPYPNNTLGCVPVRLEMDSYQKGASAHVKQSYF